MPANNRVFFAIEAAGFSEDGGATWTSVHGLQSAGITTNFNLTNVFEIGQLQVYDILEEVPQIEVTLEKVLDGTPLTYHLGTQGATAGTLSARGVTQTTIGLSVFPEVNLAASGTPLAVVQMSGMVVASLSYTFPIDGQFTESTTWQGFDKTWIDVQNGGTSTFTGTFTGSDAPPVTVLRRQDMLFTPYSGSPTGVDANGQTNAYTTVLPTDIYGISSSGTNDIDSTTGFHKCKVQSISISTDLNRDAMYEQGVKVPYNRAIGWPIEVRTDVEVMSVKFDNVDATPNGGVNGAPMGQNLNYQTIRVQTDDGTRIDCGPRNKMKSITYQGGNAGQGGGNVSLRYSYTGLNYLDVFSPVDPSNLS
jgi:hypothetical protein